MSIFLNDIGIGDQSLDCFDDDIEEFVVYGYVSTFGFGSIVFGIGWVLNLPVTGGFFTDAEQEDGCSNLSSGARIDMAALAFAAANDLGGFMAQYPPGSTFVFRFPDGSVGSYRVSGVMMSVPLTAENSCG